MGKGGSCPLPAGILLRCCWPGAQATSTGSGSKELDDALFAHAESVTNRFFGAARGRRSWP